MTRAEILEHIKNPGTPVEEYDYVNPETGNRCHIVFYDAAYRNNTPEENAAIWRNACRIAREIDIDAQLAAAAQSAAADFRAKPENGARRA